MPKDIIIIIIIIINIIIIIKALTDTQGLEAKAEECQAGTAAEGTASPSPGSHHGVPAAPSLPGGISAPTAQQLGVGALSVPQSPPQAGLPGEGV